MPLDSTSYAAPEMIEKLVERSIYASRWLLAPLYIGLSVALLVLVLMFFIQCL